MMAATTADDIQKMRAFGQRLLQSTVASKPALSNTPTSQPKIPNKQPEKPQQTTLNEDRMDVDEESKSVMSLPVLPTHSVQSWVPPTDIKPFGNDPRSPTNPTAVQSGHVQPNEPSLLGSAEQLALARSMSRAPKVTGNGGSPHRVHKENRGRLLSENIAGCNARTTARPAPYPAMNDGSVLGRLSPVSRIGKAMSASPKLRPESPTKKWCNFGSLKSTSSPAQKAIDFVQKGAEQSHIESIFNGLDSKPVEDFQPAQSADFKNKTAVNSPLTDGNGVVSLAANAATPASVVSTLTSRPSSIASPNPATDTSAILSPSLHSSFPMLKHPTTSAVTVTPTISPFAKTDSMGVTGSDVTNVATTNVPPGKRIVQQADDQNGASSQDSSKNSIDQMRKMFDIIITRMESLEKENVVLQNEVQLLIQEAERRKFLGTDSAKSPFSVFVQMPYGATLKIQATAQLKVNQFCRRLLAQAGISEITVSEPRLSHNGSQLGHLQLLGEVGVHEGSILTFAYGSLLGK